LVEIVDVEYDILLRRIERAEVHEMAIAASLDRNASDGLMLEILGHHRGRAAQECERARQHALIAHWDQFRHAAAIARSQDGDRIASSRSEQIGVSFARRLFAQTLAVLVAFGARAPWGLGDLAGDVKHARCRQQSRRFFAFKRLSRIPASILREEPPAFLAFA